jgi:hypothetical protein
VHRHANRLPCKPGAGNASCCRQITMLRIAADNSHRAEEHDSESPRESEKWLNHE